METIRIKLSSQQKPHKALVGYAAKIGLINIKELFKRLSNVFGDEIYISEILDENNLIIKANFDHDITSQL